MIWGTLNLKEPQMVNQREPSLSEINIELIKLNLRWRIATSLISICLAGIASYGQIKLQEIQANVISNEILKTQVATINESLKEVRQELHDQRGLLVSTAFTKDSTK